VLIFHPVFPHIYLENPRKTCGDVGLPLLPQVDRQRKGSVCNWTSVTVQRLLQLHRTKEKMFASQMQKETRPQI
jgi:hypothetical protein